MLKNKRRNFFETAPRLPFDGHVQIGMMEHTTLKDLAAICFKRFEARGGETLVPTSAKSALSWQIVITKKCFSTSSWSRVLTQRW